MHNKFQIDIDFECLYPGKCNILFDEWTNFLVKIEPLMKNNIKDSYSKQLLQLLFENDVDLGK